MSPLVHWHCLAHGPLQGVNYRARIAEAAHCHGVVGSVAKVPCPREPSFRFAREMLQATVILSRVNHCSGMDTCLRSPGYEM